MMWPCHKRSSSTESAFILVCQFRVQSKGWMPSWAIFLMVWPLHYWIYSTILAITFIFKWVFWHFTHLRVLSWNIYIIPPVLSMSTFEAFINIFFIIFLHSSSFVYFLPFFVLFTFLDVTSFTHRRPTFRTYHFSHLQMSPNVPSIYDVATEGSNVPKGKGVSP